MSAREKMQARRGRPQPGGKVVAVYLMGEDVAKLNDLYRLAKTEHRKASRSLVVQDAIRLMHRMVR